MIKKKPDLIITQWRLKDEGFRNDLYNKSGIYILYMDYCNCCLYVGASCDLYARTRMFFIKNCNWIHNKVLYRILTHPKPANFYLNIYFHIPDSLTILEKEYTNIKKPMINNHYRQYVYKSTKGE